MTQRRVLCTLLFLLRECAITMALITWTTWPPWTTGTTWPPYSLPNGTLRCPYVTTCVYDHTSSLTATNDPVNKPCCTPCTSGDVTKMKCCPDIAPCTLPDATPSEEHKMCVPSNFNGTFYERYILAIATCKEGSDEKEKAMCLQKYDPNIVQPLDILPVTDVNFETYRNVHCAICNGLQRRHVKFWSIRVTCETTSNIDLTKYSDIVGAVYKTPGCHINYEKPYQDTTVIYCTPLITSCNVTGLNFWGNMFDKACEEQPLNPYYFEQRQNMIFKDTACVLCNGYSSGYLTHGKPDFPALSAVLDYSSSAVPDDTQNTCKSGTVFFPQQDQCLEAKCSLTRQLHGNACSKTIQLVDSFSYKLVIRVKVVDDMDVRSGSILVTPIGRLIDSLLRQAFLEITDAVYEVLLVADTKMTDNTPSVEDVMKTKLLAIDVRAKVKNAELHDPEEKLRALLDLIADKTFAVFVNNTLFTISMSLKDDTEIDSIPDDYDECSVKLREFEICEDPDILRNISIVKIAGGHAALVYYGKRDFSIEDAFFLRPISTERNILEFRECPFTRVDTRGVHWTQVDLGLLFSNSGLFLTHSEFLYGENDSEIWICIDVYIALHGSGDMLVPFLLYYFILLIIFIV